MTGHNRSEKVIPMSEAARRYLETQTTAEMLDGIHRARHERRMDRIGECFDKPPPRRFHQANGGHRVTADGEATVLYERKYLVTRYYCRRIPGLKYIARIVF